jgi:hypothetical protein
MFVSLEYINAKYQKDRRQKEGEKDRKKEQLRGCRRRKMAQTERKKQLFESRLVKGYKNCAKEGNHALQMSSHLRSLFLFLMQVNQRNLKLFKG